MQRFPPFVVAPWVAFCAAFVLIMMVSCRDAKDYRTPYTDTVSIEFKPAPGGTSLNLLPITKINNEQQASNTSTCVLTLPPDAEECVFEVHSNAPDSPHPLTVRYTTQVSLISHERGAQRAYILTQVMFPLSQKVVMVNKSLSCHNREADVQIYF